MNAQMESVQGAGLRTPGAVMTLARMGASHPTRLSFMRQLVRNLHSSEARVHRRVWSMNSEGHGAAVYTIELAGSCYSLCAFSSELNPAERTDRVIAEAWDATFALFDGEVGSEDIERLRLNVPKQEAGRYLPTELVISRANKSVRMFDHVVDRLANGRQPDAEMLRRVGYLMRTTAVYGNGKFGLADRCRIASRPALSSPFQAELLTVWLIRGFSHDLVEHVARHQRPDTAVTLAPASKRALGIGNSTGLGMAPFLVGHPWLINNWLVARETALARVLSLECANDAERQRFMDLLLRARHHVQELEVEDKQQSEHNQVLAEEIADLAGKIQQSGVLECAFPWKGVCKMTKSLSLETQELVAAILIEPFGRLVDDLGNAMSCGHVFEIDPSMTAGELLECFDAHCGWAMELDFSAPGSCRKFWYYSEEKMEPRLGDRLEDPGAEQALAIDIAQQLQQLGQVLRGADGNLSVAELLLSYPELRHAVRRVQNAPTHPYAEIHDNLVGEGTRPIDLLRCKLAFFGATKFDPKSDLWTRITMFQGAPCFDGISEEDADDWAFPVLTEG